MQRHQQQTDALDEAAPDPLQAIRNRIDAIDEAMHRLLIDRSGVIGELIAIKGASKPGAAFRPEREADMMRRMVMRHEGRLPLVTVEHIWREIITTFTAMQAPFAIAAGPAHDPLALRDAIRFYFGFSIGVTNCASGEEAIRRVAQGEREVAILPAATDGRWWKALAGPGAPKIFAKLPFIEVAPRPADLPVYVVGLPLADAANPDVRVFAAAAADRLEAAIASHDGEIAGRAGGEVLFELPVAAMLDDLAREIGAPLGNARPLGGFARPIRCVAERTA